LGVVDYSQRFALVAILDGELVGVARFDRLDPDAAEVAFVVADAQEGRGIGSLLLEHLAGAARERDISRFEADTLLSNSAMLGVFRDAGFEATRSLSTGSCTSPSPSPRPPARSPPPRSATGALMWRRSAGCFAPPPWR
jgi:GNAT superfamily N-acetyltransferase